MPNETENNSYALIFGLISVVLILAMIYTLLYAPAGWSMWTNLIILPFALLFFVLTIRQLK